MLIPIVALLWSFTASGNDVIYILSDYPTQPASMHEENYQISSETLRTVTAYNVGDPAQNFGDPCISANGEDICTALELGERRCAANFVPFGTKLHIQWYGICVVTDRTNSRYRNRVDIAMKLNERRKAIEFGRRNLYVRILKAGRSPSKKY
jgi:3D (Asp-Asp-Asp) domain-containing protein